jgi:hypothetical protein
MIVDNPKVLCPLTSQMVVQTLTNVSKCDSATALYKIFMNATFVDSPYSSS